MKLTSNIFNPSDFKSSFLSCEKDTKLLIEKLFVHSRPYSDILKKLLVISNKDCISNTTDKYQNKIDEYSISKLKDEGYISFIPKLEILQHDEVKSFIHIGFQSFIPTPTNPQYRDVVITFTILSHIDYWDLGDFQLRPIKIMGYIDGILNNTKLSGIGTLQCIGAEEMVLGEDYSGYVMQYLATHGSDDVLESRE